MSIKTLLLSAAFSSLLCVSVFAADDDRASIASWKAGVPVAVGPVKAQALGNCTSYSAVALLENLAARNGKRMHLSPDALSVGIIAQRAAQILPDRYLEMWTKLAPETAKTSEGVSAIREESYLLNVLSTGARTRIALDYAAAAGVALADQAKTDAASLEVPRKIGRWMSWFIKKLSEPNQIYIPQVLTQDAYRELVLIFGLPVDVLSRKYDFNGKTYTAQQLVRDELGFVPERIRINEVAAPLKREELDKAALRVRKLLDQGIAVDLEFFLYGAVDDQRFLSGYFQTNEHDEGIFSSKHLPSAGGVQFGGHAAAIVNTLHDDEGKIRAFVIQNSFGQRGRDARGRKGDPATLGYDVITLDYLAGSEWSEHSPLTFTWIE